MNLTPLDQQHLKAAEGWLELGSFVEAFNELECISTTQRTRPEVFKLRYRVYAKAEKWESAFQLAEGMTRLLPDDAEVFVWRSYSARRMKGGGVRQAFELLRDVARDFPNEPVVSFNLACYCAQLGEKKQAHEWLRVAYEIAEKNGTVQALEDAGYRRTRPEGVT